MLERDVNNRTRPLFSVIMTVYNGERYLRESVESVLSQSRSDLELLAVDDASTDGSYELLDAMATAEPRIRLLRMPANSGAGAARDFAIQHAHGRFIAIADADDICFRSRLDQQLAFLQAHPDVVAVGAQALLIDENGDPCGSKTFPTDPDALYKLMYTAIPIQLPTLMVDRARLPEDFDWFEGWRYSEDSLLFFKLAYYGKIANLSEILLKYRYCSQSTSYKKAKTYFYWTWKARGIARRHYNYCPSARARLISGLQFLVITFMPNAMIPWVYKTIRGIMLKMAGQS